MEDIVKQMTALIRKEDNVSELSELLGNADLDEVCEYEDFPPASYLCAKYGRAKSLKWFLEQGVDVDIIYEKNGLSPLHVATKKNHVEIVRIILEHDSSLVHSETDGNSENNAFSIALHYAAQLQTDAILLELINASSELDKTNLQGKTALWFAVAHSHQLNINDLLSSGAKPDVADVNGITPLHVACSTGAVRPFRALVQYSSNPNVADKMGDTALHHVCQIQVQRTLFNYNMDMGNTHQQLFYELLLKTEADPEIKNGDGDTPLDIIEVPLLEVFLLVIKHRKKLSPVHMFHSLVGNPLNELKKTTIDQQERAAFVSAVEKWVTYEQDKERNESSPCTLIDVKRIPYKRKFAHLFDPSTGKPFQPNKSKTAGSGTEAVCPITGKSGPNPHSSPATAVCPITGKTGPNPHAAQSPSDTVAVCPITGKSGPNPHLASNNHTDVTLKNANELSVCPITGKSGPNPHLASQSCPVTGKNVGGGSTENNKFTSSCPFSPHYQDTEEDPGLPKCSQQ